VKQLVLKAGREKSLLRRHPWIFSGAVERVIGSPERGETVVVRSAQGRFLAHAAYSPASQIRARVWSFDEAEAIDAGFFAERVRRAVAYRAAVMPSDCEGVRLVHAESDGLPGVVVDRYADTAVIQCTSAGADAWREAIADALVSCAGCRRVYERSDAEVRRLEGLDERMGAVIGDEPPDAIRIRENRIAFLVDVRGGQKTGFFLDQRDNRDLVRASSRDRTVLDVFSYTGGFTLAALAGGATRVTTIDSSAHALAGARANVMASGLDDGAVDWLEGDAFALLRRLFDQGRRFDLVVLDPPKFAPTEKHAARAARAYKDVNLWAFKLLREGGRLLTFSCSGGVDAPLFQSIVAGAALDARVSGRIVRRLSATPDHPVALEFPEGEYLKGLVVHAG
jgi:23S rRNA (cytosine1962-C5)-methyltransferase